MIKTLAVANAARAGNMQTPQNHLCLLRSCSANVSGVITAIDR